ncbi:hypothetical protein D9M69_300560 [compost metagenome]
MHAAARCLQVGLAHEAGAVAVLQRHATGAAAEQRGPVGGLQAVGAVPEVDLELAGAELGGDHVGVDALLAGRRDGVVEHVGEARQALDVHVRLVVVIAGQRVAGELRQAVLERAVEQVELQLEGHHRADAAGLQAREHPGEHLARLELDGRGGAVGAHQHLRQRLPFPAHRLERAGDQPARRVRVAVGEAVVADRVQAALHAEQHAVLRHVERAAGGDLLDHLDGVALAVEVAGDVQADQVDVAHLGVRGAEGADFAEQVGEWLGVGHGVVPDQVKIHSTLVGWSVRLA